MPRPAPPATRPLDPGDPAAMALAVAAGVHGVYVQNALAVGEGDGFLLLHDTVPVGLCWFGPRGNLIVIAPPLLEPEPIAELVVRSRLPWRIAMGPGSVVDALRERCPSRPLLHRDQVYYECAPSAATRSIQRDDVRAAERADRDRLVQATLALNQSDLNIDPARVDRRWLRDAIDERIADGTTRVLGPLGGVECKLDFGSDGPGGLVVEGVFTFGHARGRGLAAALVATCIARAASHRVCLHVGQHNAPARAAYEHAGMVAVDRCRLLLVG